MKRYIVVVALCVVMATVAVMTLNAIKFWSVRDLHRIDPSVGQVTKLAEEKMDALAPGGIDTVFLGDSSLGYAVDAAAFDRIAGTRSVNLALTGGHGHAGALVYLRRLKREQKALRNVILFFNVDAMAYGSNLRGRFYMSPWPIEPALGLRHQIKLIGTYLSRLTELWEAQSLVWQWLSGVDRTAISDDLRARGYIASYGRIDTGAPHFLAYSMPTVIGPPGPVYLRAISRLCKAEGWNCIYIQGPMVSQAIKDNDAERAYLSASRDEIESLGIQLLDENPIRIHDEDRGDTIFHVTPTSRQKFTEIYAGLLSGLLTGAVNGDSRRTVAD